MSKLTYSINGVEIFSVGKWNGDDYTMDDLNSMVESFMETKVGLRPFIKLGHDEKQTLIQSDGLPSAGWIDKIYIRGEKLVADFIDIPKKVYDLIESKAYRKVSSEIFWNLNIGGKIYKRVLAAVALLGSDTPGVMNLNDILGMYKLNKDIGDLKIYANNAYDLKNIDYNLNIKGESKMSKTENEIKLEFSLSEVQAKKVELENTKLALEKANEDIKKENEELKKFKIEAEKTQIELALKAEKLEREKFVDALVSEKLCSPAMKNYVMELVDVEKKEYSFNDKKLSKQEVIKETLKLFKAACEVNFDENSSLGDKDSKVSEKEQDEKIKKYASENKLSYGAATKIVLKQK